MPPDNRKFQGFGRSFARAAASVAIVCIARRQHIHQQRGIFRAACHRTNDVETMRKWHHASGRHQSPCRFKAEYPAHRCRMANGAAGISAQSGRYQSGRHRNPGATGRATRAVGHRPRIQSVTVMDIVAGRRHGKFGHMQPAEINGTRLIQTLDHRRSDGSNKILADQRATCRNFALAIKQILVRHGHTMKRAEATPLGARLIGCAGRFQSLVATQRYNSIETTACRIKRIQTGLGCCHTGH